jgi:hypothetical protein
MVKQVLPYDVGHKVTLPLFHAIQYIYFMPMVADDVSRLQPAKGK